MRLFILFFILFNSTFLNSQIRPAQQSNNIKPYELPYDNIYNALSSRQEKYSQNLKFATSLLDWINELQNEDVDEQFLEDIADVYFKIADLKDKDFSLYTYELNVYESEIKNSIDKFNSRVAAINAKNNAIYQIKKDFQDDNYSLVISRATYLLSEDPFNYELLVLRALSYAETMQYDKAINDYTRLLVEDNDNILIINSIGMLYLEKNDTVNALKTFQTSLMKSELNEDALFYLGYINAKTNSSLAKEYYMKLLKFFPDHSMGNNNLGYIYLKEGNLEYAITLINYAISSNNNNYYAYDSRGEYYFLKKMYVEAILDFNKAIDLAELGNSYLIRGRCKYRLGDKIGACTDWSKAGEKNEIKAFDFIKQYCN